MSNDKVYEIIKEIESISKLMNKKISDNTECKKFTLSALMIMNQLKLGKVKTLTEISETLEIPNSTASVLVDRLVNMGLIKRERDKTDRRKVLLAIKSKGIEEEKEILKYHMDNFAALFKNASDEEIQHILKGLRTLQNVIKRK